VPSVSPAFSNVTLRPLQESDALVSVSWRNRPEIWTYTRSRPDREITVEDELAWIRAVTTEAASERFAILVDGVYVGNIYLTGLADGSAEYHIFIGERSYWGKGVARRASEALIRYAREVLRLRRITLEVHEDNLAAISLYRSLGFTPTGRDGRFVTMRLDLAGSR
jgi:diamine N-acetyltransferase